MRGTAGTLACQAKRNQSLSFHTCRFFHLADQARLKFIRIRNHLAGGDLLVGYALIAKLTYAQAAFRAGAYRRAKCPARHGAGGVKIAFARLRVESGTRLIVSKVCEIGKSSFIFTENAACRIAGETARESRHRRLCPPPYARSALRVRSLQVTQALAEALGVKLRNGKRADAALRTPGAAHQPFTALAGGIRQRGVNNLDQLPVAGGKGHNSKLAHGAGSEQGSRVSAHFDAAVFIFFANFC